MKQDRKTDFTLRSIPIDEFLADSGPMPAVLDGGRKLREVADLASFYKDALDQAAIVAVTDPKGTILSVNDRFCEISGYSEAELIGGNHRIVHSGVHPREFFVQMYRTIGRGEVWHGEICNRARDGSLYWVDTTIVPHRDSDGEIESFTAIRFDITRQKVAEQRLWRMANLDPLTDLPNRLKFIRDLESLVDPVTGSGSSVAIGLLDLDNFKDINDSLGHSAGDVVLKEVGRRLRDVIMPEDVIARLGGDEFALMLFGCAERHALHERVMGIMESLRQRVWIDGRERRISASLGIARYPADGCNTSELIKNADIALYDAKAKGRDRAQIFNEQMKARVQNRAELLAQVEHGLTANEFMIQYQPIVPLDPALPVSFEALLRWRHPRFGQILPAAFADALAEESIAAAVGTFVLDEVLVQIAEWRAAGVPFGSIAINATLGDFRSPRFVDQILTAISAGRIAKGDICVEITEGMLLGRGGKRARAEIVRLADAGLRVAFDDFGTGFASLSHLRDLPIDLVKIDKSFVMALEEPSNRAIVTSVIDLAHRLGKKVTAEGVETTQQAAILKALGCDNIQGFLMAPALPSGSVALFLAQPPCRSLGLP